MTDGRRMMELTLNTCSGKLKGISVMAIVRKHSLSTQPKSREKKRGRFYILMINKGYHKQLTKMWTFGIPALSQKSLTKS